MVKTALGSRDRLRTEAGWLPILQYTRTPAKAGVQLGIVRLPALGPRTFRDRTPAFAGVGRREAPSPQSSGP